MSLSLNKAIEEVKLNLNKRGITDVPQDINVSLLLDYSGSMSRQYQDGTVEKVLQRLLSISGTIDDDGILQLILFENRAHHYGEVTTEQYDSVKDLVKDITRKYSMGGTEFAPAIDSILKVLSSEEVEVQKTFETSSKKGGFFKSLFGKKEVTKTVRTVKERHSTGKIEGKQLLVLITDGDNSDNAAFRSKISLIEKMPNIYLQVISVGFESTYLQDIADASNSVGYSSLKDFNTDGALIESIINPELLEKFSKI